MLDITEAKKYSPIPNSEIEKITELCKSKIVIPNKSPKKQMILCPVGLVGAGKTTVIKPISKELGLVRISTDEIRKILKEHEYNYDSAKDISFNLINYFLDNGYSVAIDGNCGSKSTRTNYVPRIINNRKIDIVWIHINPPEEFILNKLKNYNHTWLFNNGDEAIKGYYAYKEHHKDADLSEIDFIYTFDTSKENLSSQINEVISKINLKLNQ